MENEIVTFYGKPIDLETADREVLITIIKALVEQQKSRAEMDEMFASFDREMTRKRQHRQRLCIS